MSFIDTLHVQLDEGVWDLPNSDYWQSDATPGMGWVTVNCLVWYKVQLQLA
jgi:hypothetical protein